MQAHQLYKKTFTRKNLTKIFEERIESTSAVGSDGRTVEAFAKDLDQEIDIILRKIESDDYRFTAYREKLISKGAHSNPRQISIPTIRDRLVLRALCNLVQEIFKDCAARPPHEYIKEIWSLSASLGKDYSFVRMDIKNYYPSIAHEILLRHVRRRIRKPQIVSLLKGALTTPTNKTNVPENQSHSGVPQGLSVSNILSSVYLNPIDTKYRGKGAQNIHYFRYVDDILILCKSAEAHKIYTDLKYELLHTASVECHELAKEERGKTTIKSLSHGIDYLGFRISDAGVSVRSSSCKLMFTNLMRVFTRYKHRGDKRQFLWRLNLKITGCRMDGKRFGWMQFFSQVDDTGQIQRLDAFVRKLAQKHGLESDIENIRTFIKSYHEIRFNSDDTKYIPNFETYTRDQMISVMMVLGKLKGGKKLDHLSDTEVRKMFLKYVGREVAKLEKELLQGFS